MTEYLRYRRKQIAELADWTPAFDMTGVSISEADRLAGSPKAGDKIARNPANHSDRWLVAADYFTANFEPIDGLPEYPAAPVPSPEPREPTLTEADDGGLTEALWISPSGIEYRKQRGDWRRYSKRFQGHWDGSITLGTLEAEMLDALAHIGKRPAMSEDAKDAARYRWLRDNREEQARDGTMRDVYDEDGTMLYGADLDAAIDAALSTAPAQPTTEGGQQ